MPFLRGADGPALHIKGGTWNQCEDRGSIALSDALVVSKDRISRSVGAVSSVTVAALHRYVYQIGFCHPTGPLSSGFPVDAL